MTKLVGLYDNGGETFDRYTAVYDSDDYQWYRGMSDNPFHPQGFGISNDGDVSGTMERDTKIEVADAPEMVRKCITMDLEGS